VGLDLDEVRGWWIAEGTDEAEMTLRKAEEYGSLDLEIIGKQLKQLASKNQVVDPAEIGIAFYVLGKAARLMSGYAAGSKPSDDTWRDIACYTKMAQRIRSSGRWP
jgi:hypothetical protein